MNSRHTADGHSERKIEPIDWRREEGTKAVIDCQETHTSKKLLYTIYEECVTHRITNARKQQTDRFRLERVRDTADAQNENAQLKTISGLNEEKQCGGRARRGE